MTNTVKVQPVLVPWMVSPSTPNFFLACDSTQPEVATILRFLAFFGEESTFENINGYAKVMVIFENGFWVRYYPDFSSSEQKRLDSYNWEQIPEFRDNSGSLKGSKARFREYWQQTYVCPNPAMYRLIDSDWIKELELSDYEYEHYLVIGDDFNVEVICRNYSWKIEA
ncbi:hypothetical protein IQ254_29605 [Nodosilinea sp. LEGE 07088]|uniref:hypothetical protein n=1 Tax=Nodosilinea sp. LEGE 07088 TaxID=2777968 RepID=UPI00187E2909|nr:hypothetical protein [Nodosilinea sp. LEGE 07088]MBE9141299.1 hypothetical protein [Nodosilinea sp. LEGE 07088]